jgi:membrane fusion protein (multidrug efflux system)
VLPASATVHLKLEDGSDYPETGTIEFSEVSVDENAGTVVLRAASPTRSASCCPACSCGSRRRRASSPTP